MSAIGDICVRRWRSILTTLGVDGKMLTGRHGPCPVCGGSDRFRFDDKDGRGTWICSVCGAGDGFKLLQLAKGWTFAAAASEVERIVGRAVESAPRKERPEDEARNELRSLWRGALRLTGEDLVARYLASRGLAYDVAGGPIRFAPSAWCKEGAQRFRPAMIALVLDPAGKAANVQRTYLTDQGAKAPLTDPRRTIWGCDLPDGCAVRLTDPAETLGIAEGIETALSASALFGVPCWAALTANRLAVWQPPKQTRRVVIFGDNDASYTGQAAAYSLAWRLAAKQLAVNVRLPAKIGQDWNDVLVESVKANED